MVSFTVMSLMTADLKSLLLLFILSWHGSPSFALQGNWIEWRRHITFDNLIYRLRDSSRRRRKQSWERSDFPSVSDIRRHLLRLTESLQRHFYDCPSRDRTWNAFLCLCLTFRWMMSFLCRDDFKQDIQETGSRTCTPFSMKRETIFQKERMKTEGILVITVFSHTETQKERHCCILAEVLSSHQMSSPCQMHSSLTHR